MLSDPRIIQLAQKVIDAGKNKRAIVVLKALLEKGEITTDDLNDLGYNHPPRAVADVRDLGIPVVTDSVKSERTGKRMAVYRFGDPKDIQEGRLSGRRVFPKSFKSELIRQNGSFDAFSRAEMPARALQIDHRIPYRIAGDADIDAFCVEDYMLLDASSQRAKSWSCENCANYQTGKSISICRTCYWAFPENYDHIEMKPRRRVELVFQEGELELFDVIQTLASEDGISMPETIKRLLKQRPDNA